MAAFTQQKIDYAQALATVQAASLAGDKRTAQGVLDFMTGKSQAEATSRALAPLSLLQPANGSRGLDSISLSSPANRIPERLSLLPPDALEAPIDTSAFTTTTLNPVGQLGLAGLSGGLSALGQVLMQNRAHDQEKDRMRLQAELARPRFNREGAGAMLGLIGGLNRPPGQPFTPQSALPPAPQAGAQSTADLERRLAEMRQRLSAIRR